MTDSAQSDAIAAVLADEDEEALILAGSVLGTTDPEEISRNVDAFCKAHLGSGFAGCFLCELSVGAAFGLRLRDDRRVFLKAHPPGRSPEFLRAVHRVQAFLFERGFPCPAPLAPPAPFGVGFAAVEEFVDEGELADAHEPPVRRAMARALARMVDLATAVSDVEALSQGWTWPEEELWPVPHNALFDFGATARGAG